MFSTGGSYNSQQASSGPSGPSKPPNDDLFSFPEPHYGNTSDLMSHGRTGGGRGRGNSSENHYDKGRSVIQKSTGWEDNNLQENYRVINITSLVISIVFSLRWVRSSPMNESNLGCQFSIFLKLNLCFARNMLMTLFFFIISLLLNSNHLSINSLPQAASWQKMDMEWWGQLLTTNNMDTNTWYPMMCTNDSKDLTDTTQEVIKNNFTTTQVGKVVIFRYF